MRTPVLLMLAVLAFWGWQSGLTLLALAMGALLEGSRWTPARWQFSETDLRRIWSLCTLLFFAGVIVSFISNDGTSGLLGLLRDGGVHRTESLNATTRSVLVALQWLPVVFYPMMVAQAYGQSPTIDSRVFSWFLRRRHGRNPNLPSPPSFNFTHPYLMTCLLAASTANAHRAWFFPGMVVFTGLMLSEFRNPRHSARRWASMLVAAALVGFAGQLGIRQLQRIVQNLDTSWLGRMGVERVDKSSTVTDLGRVGRLKLSGRIILRVDPVTQPVPELLREASYNEFQSPGLWYSAQKPFQSFPQEDETSWNLLPGKPVTRSVRISRHMQGPRGLGVLAVPNGTARLEDLTVFTLMTNTMGVLKVNDGAGVLSYRALFGDGATIDAHPEEADRIVPRTEAAAVKKIAEELRLDGLEHQEVLARVAKFFVDRFHYTTYRGEETPVGSTPLRDFLLNGRSGHCEYFATAAVFLLREAGIPARYAIGYSVQERRGDRYLVRGRHAHAWCLAFIDGTWRDFDPTPPSWNDVESRKAGFWEPVSDLFSDLWFAFSKWRWSDPGVRKYLPWLIVPPLAVVAFRLVFRRQWQRARNGRRSQPKSGPVPGRDSEFYLLEASLLARGLARQPGEPVGAWIRRLSQTDESGGPALEQIVRLHYRYRFDPAGLSPSDRASLKQAVSNWLAR